MALIVYVFSAILLSGAYAQITCQGECLSGLPAQCGGQCPFSLLAGSNDEDGDVSAASTLCAPPCTEAWTAAEACLGDGNAPAVEEIRLMERTCDALCFLEEGASPDAFEIDCLGPLTGGECSPACKTLVTETLSEECRTNVVASISPQISMAATTVFDECGASYTPYTPETPSAGSLASEPASPTAPAAGGTPDATAETSTESTETTAAGQDAQGSEAAATGTGANVDTPVDSGSTVGMASTGVAFVVMWVASLMV